MSYQVKEISEECLVLGEGPHWDDREQALYYVDILQKHVHRYHPATNKHTKAKLDGRVGFIIPVEGVPGQFVVGLERAFSVVQWDGVGEAKVLRALGEVDQDKPTNRINDAKADPRGRLFGGTMGHEEPPGNFAMNRGSLFRYDGGFTKICDNVTISNGLAWDLKEKTFYYTDSMDRAVRGYDYDVETGNISNKRFVFELEKNEITGFPDGCTIDTDGNLWVAVFDGSCVLQVDPRTGKLLRHITIPAKQVTSATFGGPDLDILFVTTASMNIQGEQKPPCGRTFMVTGLGVKGHKNVNVKL